MKMIKSLALLFIAATIALGANAQGASTGKKETKTTTSKTTTTSTKTEAKPAASTGKTATTGKTEAKPASGGGTKPTDAVDASMKGPKGETVYTGPKGGKYYLKDGKKVYLKKEQ